MIKEQINSNELDRLLNNALTSNADLTVPSGITSRTIRRIEKMLLFRELVFELVFKVGLIVGSLAILTGVFVIIYGYDVLNGLYGQFLDNWQLITSLLLLIFIVTLIDQVGLRFYIRLKNEVGLKA
jgi:hypothetical protein